MLEFQIITIYLLIFINNFSFLSCSKKSSNIGFTPIVKVKASFNTCFKCNSDSLADKLLDTSSSVSLQMTCNGFLYNEVPYDYKIYFEGSEELLVLSQLHRFTAFLNGNMISINNGYVTNGTCAGDYLYSVGFSMAEDQKGCNNQTGIKSHEILWDMFQILGKCNSVCYGKGVISFNPGISNNGAVD